MKIENEEDYKLMSKLAYNLSFNAPFKGVEFTKDDINVLVNTLDAYDKENGYTTDTPSQEALDEHDRDRTNANKRSKNKR